MASDDGERDGGARFPLALALAAWLALAGAAGSALAQTVFQPSVQKQSTATEGCASLAEVAEFAENWLEGRPSRALARAAAETTLEDALCTQQRLVDRLRLTLGEPIGHVVGLTNGQTQALFDTDRPIRGIALEGMLLDNGALLPERFGHWPFIEADLLVIVASEAINDARTPLEVLEHVSAVRPFIGLVDIGVDAPELVDPISLTAQNTGARYGVLGAPVAAPATPAFVETLAGLKATLTNAAGEAIAQGAGADFIGGNPLNSVLWLLDQGVRLRRGDMVNLGSFGAPAPSADAKGGAVAAFHGLPGTPTVQVRFR